MDGTERETESESKDTAHGSRNGDYFSRQESSSSPGIRQTPQARRIQADSVRPRLSSIQSPTTPTTPRTPLLGRSISSSFNSPVVPFRTDDEYFVFEFSSRYLRAGLGGESRPRCKIAFSPQMQVRAGDYSRWLLPKTESVTEVQASFETWDAEHVLWRMDLRSLDLGLVADKMERTLRTAITEHLLVMDDSKKRKFVIALPPIMPHPLLSVLLGSIFNLYPPPPSIMLLSSPVLCTVGAGLRSSLIVDLGWAATRVSAVYEYREVKHRISRRAMKLVSWNLRELLTAELKRTVDDTESLKPVTFEETEEVLNRIVWCKRRPPGDTTLQSDESTISIPLRSQKPPKTLSIPFSYLCQPIERGILGTEEPQAAQDDDELSIPFLMYSTLLSIPIDVRQTCLSRIVITGGGSNIPGLKSRLIEELSYIVASRGWDPVHNYGSAKKRVPRRTFVKSEGVTPIHEASGAVAERKQKPVNKDIDPNSETPTHLQPPLPDPILSKLYASSTARRHSRDAPDATAGRPETHSEESSIVNRKGTGRKIRSVKSLGAWEGASLLAGLRARGMVEVDRDKFMQHGLNSGIRIGETKRQSIHQSQTQRPSLIGLPGASGIGKVGEKDSGAWTLGPWA